MSRRRIWLRRLAILGLLAVAARLVLPYALRPIAQSALASSGLNVAWDDLELGLFRGEVRLHGLELTDARASGADDARVAHLDQLSLDLDVSELLMGKIAVHDIEIDGLDIFVERDADGAWSYAGFFASEDNPKEEDSEESEPAPLVFSAPLRMTSLRLQDVRIHLTNRLVSPAVESRIELDLLVNDIGVEGRPAKLDLRIHAPDCLDILRLEGRLEGNASSLEIELDCDIVGLRPHHLAGFLASAGIVPAANAIDVTAHLSASVQVNQADPTRLNATARLDEFELDADSRSVLSIEEIEARITGFSGLGLQNAELTITGVHARATRRIDGSLVAAGLGFVASPATEEEQTEAPATEEAPAPAFHLGPTNIKVSDLRFALDDEADSLKRLEFVLESLTLSELACPAVGDTPPASFAMRLRAPRIFDSLEVSGELTPGREVQKASLELAIDGLQPGGLAAQLESSGWQPTFEKGRVRGRLRAEHRSAPGADGETSRLDAFLGPLVWSDVGGESPVELARLDAIRLAGFEMEAGGNVRVAELEVRGGSVDGERDSTGNVRIAGFEYTPRAGAAPAPDSAEESADAPANTQTQDTGPVTTFEVGSARWHGTHVSWRDEALTPPLALELDPFSLELKGLAIGVRDQHPPAELDLSLAIPGLLSSFTVAGEIASRPGEHDVSLSAVLSAEGIDLNPIADYLVPLGIEPKWNAGRIGARLDGRVRRGEDGVHLALSLDDVQVRPNEEVALGWTSLRVDDVHLGADGTRIGTVTFEAPRAQLFRDSDGALRVAGFRLVAPSPAETAPAVTDEATSAKSGGLWIEGIEVQGMELSWQDESLEPRLAAQLRADAQFAGFSTAAGAAPATFSLELEVPDSLERFELTGELQADPSGLVVNADLLADGLRPGPLGRYLPSHVTPLLDAGSLSARFELDWGAGEAALPEGKSGHARLLKLSFQDGEREWLALERAAVEVQRYAPDGEGIVIADIACEGLVIDTARDEEGRFEMLGFAFSPAKTPASTSPETAGESELAPATAAARPDARWPDVLLERMHIAIDTLRFEDRLAMAASNDSGDESSEGSVPLEFSLVLETPPKLVLANAEPENLPPFPLHIRGSALPLARELAIDATLAPYRPTPAAELSLAVRGIDGSALARVLPATAAAVDASAFTDGEFGLTATAALRARRRSPIDFDFSHGFGLELNVEDLLLRAQPDTEALLALPRLAIDIASIRPETGDVHIRSIEAYDPILRIVKEKTGTRVAGLFFPANAEEAPGEADPDASEEAEIHDQEVTVGPELRIDQVLVQGLDLTFEDNTVEPPLVLPFDDLEVEVEQFTTRAYEEPRPIRFRANVGAGGVRLPVRSENGNLLSSLVSEVGSAIGLDDVEYEERALFDEIDLSGSLVFVPALTGWVKLTVLALELAALRGIAAGSGVTLEGGVLDGNYDVRFLGDRGASVATASHFSSLDISEPDDGPIERFLGLPAPLGAVLYLLKDANGEHRIPLSFSVGPDGVSTSAISAAATKTLLELITRAIAQSPYRIVQGALDLTQLDLFGSSQVPLEEAQRTLAFAPGSADLTPTSRAAVRSLVPLLREDGSLTVVLTHTFATADQGHAEKRANPSEAHLRDLISRLRGERAALWHERDQKAAATRAAFATGARNRAEALRLQLVDLDDELARCERAVDAAGELLRPGAERQRDQRTRAALRALADERLQAVREMLIKAGVPSIRKRVRIRRPRLDIAPDQASASVALTPRRRRE